jgi:hypothetical protein
MGTINNSDRIAATLYSLGTLFVSGMQGIYTYVCINTLHKGDSDDDDDNNNNNNNRGVKTDGAAFTHGKIKPRFH